MRRKPLRKVKQSRRTYSEEFNREAGQPKDPYPQGPKIGVHYSHH